MLCSRESESDERLRQLITAILLCLELADMPYASCSPTLRLVIEYGLPNNSSTVEKTGGSHEN